MKTLRDEFALLRASQTVPLNASSFDGVNIMYKQWAEECYAAADAFMEARDRLTAYEGVPLPVPPSAPEEPLFDGFDDEPPQIYAGPAYAEYPMYKDGLVFTEQDMELVEDQAYQLQDWINKWDGVPECSACISMSLTPIGYRCTACGAIDIPF